MFAAGAWRTGAPRSFVPYREPNAATGARVVDWIGAFGGISRPGLEMRVLAASRQNPTSRRPKQLISRIVNRDNGVEDLNQSRVRPKRWANSSAGGDESSAW
jgi:hypothetical protein